MTNHPTSKLTTEGIWRTLSDRLRLFIRSRIPTAADVDDILQTVFLRIHKKLGDIRRVDRLEPWVFQITRNAITDFFRKKGTAILDGPNDVPEKTAASDENANQELANCLATLIDQLPDDQQRALTLYELQGISQAEIAERESISLSGAKSRIQRGRKNLELILNECCRLQFDRFGNVLDFEPAEHCSDCDCPTPPGNSNCT